jgi:hypothetical protein
MKNYFNRHGTGTEYFTVSTPNIKSDQNEKTPRSIKLIMDGPYSLDKIEHFLRNPPLSVLVLKLVGKEELKD